MRLPDARKFFALTAATSALMMTAACGGDSDPADPVESTPTATDTVSGDNTEPAAPGEYVDGTYEASGDYPNPGGVSSVDVTLTVADGKVDAVEVKAGATGTSLMYQREFIDGIADQIVGKSIDELDVSKVSGSSLTSQGFNKALEQIKADAQA